MRGVASGQTSMLLVWNPLERIAAEHPIRRIKTLADEALEDLSRVFNRMYAQAGRPSIPPERLLKGCLLIALYSLRGERQLCEQLEYNLLFRWFLDMELDEEPFNHSVFAKNRDRLLEHEVAGRFFEGVLAQARARELLSSEHFSVDGSLIEAWASLKSFRPKDGPPAPLDDDPGNPTVNFRGEQRRNDTHASTTDPQARLAKKSAGTEAKLAYYAHVLMENRHGLCVDITITPPSGRAEPEQALAMVKRQQRRGVRIKTLGADSYYDNEATITALRKRGVTPHVAQHPKRRNLDKRTTRHEGYAASQRCRKKIEEIFGWMKTVGGFRRTRYRGTERTDLWAHIVGSAYNLVRIAKLQPAAA